jgi:hypothetical protein
MGHYSKLPSAFANVAPSTTDASLVVGSTNRVIRVYAMAAECGATATTITFNTATGGVGGVAISMNFQNPANGGFVLPYSEAGWFQTNAGDYLTCSTGGGSTTGIQLLYAIETVPGKN